jgi:hypothetical protein
MFALTLVLFACSDEGSNNGNNENIEGNSLLLNFTSNNESGELRWMDINATSLAAGSISFDQDSKVIAHNGQVFVLERPNFGTKGNLSCINPQTMAPPNSSTQKSLENASNPYDIAFAGNKGFIALYGLDYLQTFDASSCTLGEKIDFPGNYANGLSFSANASSIKTSGDTLLVILQRLTQVDGWLTATKPGLLLRIKTNGAFIDTIQLKFHNPQASVLNGGKLIVASNNYGSAEGIEIVNLATGMSETLATGEQLGGGVSSIALDEVAQTLYASIYATWGTVPVKPINLSSKSVGSALSNITDSFNGLVFDSESKKLFIADAAGLKIYDTVLNTTTPVNEGNNALPPYSLAIVRW